jgi:hypothetical protein
LGVLLGCGCFFFINIDEELSIGFVTTMGWRSALFLPLAWAAPTASAITPIIIMRENFIRPSATVGTAPGTDHSNSL